MNARLDVCLLVQVFRWRLKGSTIVAEDAVNMLLEYSLLRDGCTFPLCSWWLSPGDNRCCDEGDTSPATTAQ